ncbi:MAG: hypothetical protein Q4C47_03025, partial [Planctomycetia bacterium]|nr:hypothetical protein [Planctomycetia bacterium]
MRGPVQSVFGASAPDLSTLKGKVECLERIRGVSLSDVSETDSSDTAWAYFFAVRRFVSWLSFRPAGTSFTGSNPDFGLKYDVSTGLTVGPLDVDNDGDGVPDSVWVDMGLPEQVDADGNRVRPLVAVYCIDLDGRLNVNAHGGDSQLVYGTRGPAGQPLGRGFGPAEVNLALDDGSLLQRLLYGDSSRGIEGRLGEWGTTLPGGGYTLTGSVEYPDSLANAGYLKYSNVAAWNCFMPQLLTTGAYGNAAHWDFLFGILPDTRGTLYCGVLPSGAFGGTQYDTTGNQGLAIATNNVRALNPLNSNYWIDLTTPRRNSSGGKVQIDNPYTPAELERLLRMYDADEPTLTPRLVSLLNNATTNRVPEQRFLYTTDSYHTPALPAVELPQYVVEGTVADPEYTSIDDLRVPTRYGTLTEALVRYLRIMERGNYDAVVTPYDSGDTVSAQTLIADEFYAGIPMDPNRLFVDEQYLLDNPAATVASDEAIAAGKLERQAMARQLYILAKYLTRDWKPDLSVSGKVDLTSLPGYEKIPSGMWSSYDNEKREKALVSVWLAQWAVNVVDFRDRDSAMTPFWFDPFPNDQTVDDNDPFGWTEEEDGLICVFGCERPDLLITETLATHARRTEDTSEDPTGKKTTDDDAEDEPQEKDFDQKRRPIGSLFVELYNPWGSGEAAPSVELRSGDWTNETAVRSVTLNMVNGNNDPVWRLGFREVPADSTEALNFELRDPLNWERSGLAFDRVLYFSPPQPLHSAIEGFSATGGDMSETLRFVASSDRNTAEQMMAEPGMSVVIGPYDREWKTRTPLAKGHDTDDWFNWDETRYIDLRDDQHSTDGFSVWYNYNANSGIAAGGRDPFNASAVHTVVVDQVCTDNSGDNWVITGGEAPRFSVSEPSYQSDSSFYNVKWQNDPSGTDTGGDDYYYDTVSGSPEQYSDKEIQKNGCAGQEGTTPDQYRHRLVCLQRLADPRLPYNPDPTCTTLVYNPYITVDKAPIDLVTYNGWNPDVGAEGLGEDESAEPYPEGLEGREGTRMRAETEIVFRSRERGYFRQNYYNLTGGGTRRPDLWPQEPILDQIQFNREKTLRSLVGFNEERSEPISVPTTAGGTTLSGIHFLQYLSHSFGSPVNICFATRTVSEGGVVVRPEEGTYAFAETEDHGVFPLLTWPNSPYNSRMELMYVPITGTSRLLAAPLYFVDSDEWKLVEPGYSLVGEDDGFEELKPTVAEDGESIADVGDEETPYRSESVHGLSEATYRWYPHLMNFFETERRTIEVDTSASGGGTRETRASNFGQILDFIDTPSPYSGRGWRREPGKINLNTVTVNTVTDGSGLKIWRGLTGAVNDSIAENYEKSRQWWTGTARWGVGSSGEGESKVFLDGTVPSIFPNPLRATSAFATAFNERYDPETGGSSSTSDYRQLSPSVLNTIGVNEVLRPDSIGMLRSLPVPDTSDPGDLSDRQPLLAYTQTSTEDSVRNVRFRYEQIQRMANLTTMRSSVDAVWVTLGYFQVLGKDADGRPLLGEEVEGPQGIPERPRAFYIFDRSIPTGYMPGENRGTDRAVLLRRI